MNSSHKQLYGTLIKVPNDDFINQIIGRFFFKDKERNCTICFRNYGKARFESICSVTWHAAKAMSNCLRIIPTSQPRSILILRVCTTSCRKRLASSLASLSLYWTYVDFYVNFAFNSMLRLKQQLIKYLKPKLIGRRKSSFPFIR